MNIFEKYIGKKINSSKLISDGLLDLLKIRTNFLDESAGIPQRIWHEIRGEYSVKLCSGGNRLSFDNFSKGYRTRCSDKKCTCFEDMYRENGLKSIESGISKKRTVKANDTIRKKYGVSNALQINPQNQKNRSRDLQETINEKIKETVRNRYGVDYIFQHETIKNLIREKNLSSWKGLHEELFSREIMIDLHQNQKLSCLNISKKFNVSIESVISSLKRLNISQSYHSRSSLEIEMADFLKSINVKFIENSRNILPSKHQLDFFLPDYNIAIEMNGLYWHSSRFVPEDYHQKKTQECEDSGIRLFQIFEDEWICSREKCQKTILHALGLSEKGIGARKASIREISWKEAKPFLDANHHQNAGAPGSYNLGAFYENKMIAVMVFGRFSNESIKKYQIEMKRFVTDGKSNPGLATRMFSKAVRDNGYQEVIAFVDRRWFNGKFKFIAGFEIEKKTSPSLFYTRGIERKHRTFITKDKLKGTGTKKERLFELGYHQIFDSGKLKLKWKSKEMTSI